MKKSEDATNGKNPGYPWKLKKDQTEIESKKRTCSGNWQKRTRGSPTSRVLLACYNEHFPTATKDARRPLTFLSKMRFCLYRHLNHLLDSAELYVLLRLCNPLLRHRTVYVILFLQIQWLKPVLLIRGCRYPLTRPRRRYAVSCRLYSRGVTSCSHSLVRWCAILAITIPRVTPSKYFLCFCQPVCLCGLSKK